MREADVHSTGRITLAEKAAELLLDDEDDGAVAIYEPTNRQEANAAVRRFGQLFADLRGKFRKSIEAARDSGSLLSSDRLQGLSEIVQNADDAGATQVRILLAPERANGEPRWQTSPASPHTRVYDSVAEHQE